MMRSMLFVPGDSQRKMEKALQVGADALIVDLEDAVAAAARPAARELTAEYLRGKSNVWVRINPINTADAALDIAAVVKSSPAGIVLPKPRNGDDVAQLSLLLTAAEKKAGLPEGRIPVLPIVTETPASMLSLGSYTACSERLQAMSWGGEDLSAALGASSNRDERGEWLAPYALARSLCLYAAAAAEVAALDTVYTDFANADGLRQYAANARRDGFTGMLAIHPAQVDVINNAFLPSHEEIDRAQRIVELFTANPQDGALALDGQMIDRPHLIQARRVLELAKALQGR